jgi:MFS family permease
MVGCWIVSLAGADASTNSCFIGAAAWVAVALFSRRLPAVAPPKSAETITLRQRLGLDALTLLRRADHRVVFLAAALFSIPLAAFYPFTPTHLRQLGLERTTAWMTLGQITEIIAMVGLSIVLGRWPIKRTLAAGLAFGVLRYSLCALDGTGWVLAGLTLHGFAFTLFFITSQIYLDRRVDPAWRARAQALFSLMLGGVGNLLGYLGTGWWFQAAHRGDQMRWPLFWGLLAAIVAAVMVYFVSSYREEDRVAGRDTQAPVARRV